VGWGHRAAERSRGVFARVTLWAQHAAHLAAHRLAAWAVGDVLHPVERLLKRQCLPSQKLLLRSAWTKEMRGGAGGRGIS